MNLAKIIFSLLVSLAISFCIIGEIYSAEECVVNISYERGVMKTSNEEDLLTDDGYIVEYKDETGDVLKDGEIYDNQNLVTREESTDIYYSGESAEDSTGDLIENFLILLQSSDN